MQPYDLTALAAQLPLLDLESGPTREQALAASRRLGGLGTHELGLARFRGQPPWERHTQDELIQVLAGSLELKLRMAEGEQSFRLEPGQLFLVPANVWHRSDAQPEVTLLYGTPAEGNEHSLDETP